MRHDAPYERIFNEQGDFAALNAAQAWLKEQGYSYGSWARGLPCGILKGDALIAKWRNMTAREISQLDGQMYGDGRNGPIKVVLTKYALEKP